MKNLYTSISFIFSMMCLADISKCAGFTRTNVQNKASVSIGLKMVTELIQSGKKCIDKSMFPIVRSDSKAVLEYVSYVCGQVERRNAKQYVKDNYGVPEKLLGSGSFGKVYLFRNSNNEKFAIKIPKNFNYRDLFMEVNASECIKEKTAGTDINDKFGVILSCPWPQHDNPNLVMKFLPETLTQFNKQWFKQPWSSYSDKRKGAALDVMSTMAKEIALLHSVDIAHRDLKPDNIMVTVDQNPVIVDFGLTSPMGERARTNGGTPYFLDYELMNGTGNGISADVYSMFIIFASMVGGPKFESYLEAYLRRGNYVAASKGRGKYFPKFDNLNIPSEFSWFRNMYVPIKNGRWNMNQVVAKLNNMEVALETEIEAKNNIKLPVINQPIPKVPIIQNAIKEKVFITREQMNPTGNEMKYKKIVRPQGINNNNMVRPKKYEYIYKRLEDEHVKNRPQYSVRPKISPADLMKQYDAQRQKRMKFI